MGGRDIGQRLVISIISHKIINRVFFKYCGFFSKILRYIFAQRVVANNKWLLIATSGCEQRVVANNEWLLARLGQGFFESWYMY